MVCILIEVFDCQMATIAMVRFLGLTATHIPTSQWITSKVKLVWDILMALPIF
jgi:hypothetical protein